DRDLYVWAANISDGILTAHPQYKGKHLQDFEGKHGAPFGQTIMHGATHGAIKETTYWCGRAMFLFMRTTNFVRLRRRAGIVPMWSSWVACCGHADAAPFRQRELRAVSNTQRQVRL
ncbi:MAG: hypothetical protein WAK55_07540, partial [Xanthobacteraceae bacterium]